MRHVIRRLAALVAAALTVSMLSAPAAGAASPSWSHRDLRICGPGTADTASCLSLVRELYQNGQGYSAETPGALRSAARAAATVSYAAVDIRKAYGITTAGDPSRVIAIVDAYDDPAAFSNLKEYRTSMGLPAINNCSLSALTALTSTAGTPCFAKVDQTGGTSYPRADSGWANEIDLDLQAASAVCPMCSILLLEASTASFANLGTAVTTASNTAHVLAISNSYGSTGDASGASYPQWDNAAKKGLAVTASTGDNGYGASFPASGTYVLAVGGTNLQVDASGLRSSETAWTGAGSGCSTYNRAPSWQGSPCGTMKASADVSADADPSSGLQVYTTYSGKTGWYVFGGTSLSSPLTGALYAMQGGYGPRTSYTYAGEYAWASSTAHYDVTTGSNGTCTTAILCNAAVGWDGPTGLGSIQMAPVVQTLTKITVSPASASVAVSGQQQFTATAYDQSGVAMVPQPAFTWTVSGVGSIDSGSGLYSAGTTTGTATVTAASDSVSGTASVTVTAVAPDFTLAVSPSSLTVKRGTTATYTVTIGAVGSFSGSVDLRLSGAPAGSTVTFTPIPVSAGQVTLTISTSASTKAKTYSMTVTGTSGSLIHTASLSLRVANK